MRHVVAAWLIALAFGVCGPGASAQPRDPTVTSDSSEYCGVLIGRVFGLIRASTSPLPTEATELSEEGRQMCANGQYRGGILRLRRALILMHGTETYNSIVR